MTTNLLSTCSISTQSRSTWVSRLVSSIALLVLGTLPTVSLAIEEPTFSTVRSLEDGIEVREYAAYTVAEVVLSADANDAGNRAFPILAGYIFGKNKGERKMAMTAPVTQVAAPMKMEMTAPVTQMPTATGFLVQFVLPKGITVANAPEPLDARVMLREVAPKRIAVIRYSGFWSQSNYTEHLNKLETALRASNMAWTGEPVLSRYDGPTTPWFMRRNEIWLNLAQ